MSPGAVCKEDGEKEMAEGHVGSGRTTRPVGGQRGTWEVGPGLIRV